MKQDEFDLIITNRLKKVQDILIQKGKEYSKDYDKLHNFNTASRIKGCTPIEALDGMMLKHYVSYQDMVQGKVDITSEMIDAKIGDLIAYLLLAECVLEDKLRQKLPF